VDGLGSFASSYSSLLFFFVDDVTVFLFIHNTERKDEIMFQVLFFLNYKEKEQIVFYLFKYANYVVCLLYIL